MTVSTTVLSTPAAAPVTAISADGSVIAVRNVVSGSIGLFDARTGRSLRSQVGSRLFSRVNWDRSF